MVVGTAKGKRDRIVFLQLHPFLLQFHAWALSQLFVPWQKHLVDIGHHASLGDGDILQESVQLFIVPDGQLQVSRRDPDLLVVSCRVSSKLQDLGAKIL
jgi:hypothetical protein